MAAGYKWHPITDLGDDPRSLTDGELDSLWRVWQSQKKDLAEREVLSEFEQRRRREWPTFRKSGGGGTVRRRSRRAGRLVESCCAIDLTMARRAGGIGDHGYYYPSA